MERKERQEAEEWEPSHECGLDIGIFLLSQVNHVQNPHKK